MAESSIKLVCFDLGGVVIRICRSWPDACAAAAIASRCDWEQAADARHQISMQLSTGRINHATWAHQVSELYDGLYSPQELCAIHGAWLLGEYQGVGEVIDRIHRAGAETASLSNTDHAHWDRMPEFPAFMKLQHRWASHLLHLVKPDPAIYREFERRVNHRSGEILFFDDLPENIEAARAAGWNAELIDPQMRTDSQIQAGLERHGVLHGKRRQSAD
jgi:HAD superfamily hydrolase (TIGR01509 family)